MHIQSQTRAVQLISIIGMVTLTVLSLMPSVGVIAQVVNQSIAL